MPIAIRNITRIQDADDANLTLGAGTDGYAITWDNGTSKFVMAEAGGSSLPVVDETAIVYKTGQPTCTVTLDADALTTARTKTLQNTSATLAELETAQTFTAGQVINVTSSSQPFKISSTNGSGNMFVVQHRGDSNWLGTRFEWTDVAGANAAYFEIGMYYAPSVRILRWVFNNLTEFKIYGLSDYVWQFSNYVTFLYGKGIASAYHENLSLSLRINTTNPAKTAIRFYTQDTANLRMSIFEDGQVNIGSTSTPPDAKLRIQQSSSTAAIPVLRLDQADDSEEMIEFTGTVGTGNAIEAVGAKTLTTTHFIRINITGVGYRYIPVGTIA